MCHKFKKENLKSHSTSCLYASYSNCGLIITCHIQLFCCLWKLNFFQFKNWKMCLSLILFFAQEQDRKMILSSTIQSLITNLASFMYLHEHTIKLIVFFFLRNNLSSYLTLGEKIRVLFPSSLFRGEELWSWGSLRGLVTNLEVELGTTSKNQ